MTKNSTYLSVSEIFSDLKVRPSLQAEEAEALIPGRLIDKFTIFDHNIAHMYVDHNE